MHGRFRLIIFDFDGTLADSFPFFVRVVNDMAKEFSFSPIEDHEIEGLRSYSSREMMRHLNVPIWKMPAIAASMRSRMAAAIDEIPLFDGIPDVLADLKNHGLTTAVVTSNSEENVRHVLGPCVQQIDYFECGASLMGKKAKLKKVVAFSGIEPRQALLIGDEIRDYEAAKKTGMAFAGVEWGYTTPSALRQLGPDLMFPTVASLSALT